MKKWRLPGQLLQPYQYEEAEMPKDLHSQRADTKRGQRPSVHMGRLFSLSLEEHLALELPSFTLKGFGAV